jgi:predicted acylesterase/phospholipase RssA
MFSRCIGSEWTKILVNLEFTPNNGIKDYVDLYTIMISHLFLSGGGLKGLCYFGILRYLYIENMVADIRTIWGSSIGAFFATIIALRIPVEIVEQEFHNVVENIHELLSINKTNLSNIFCKNGMLSVAFLVQPIIKHLESTFDCNDITFIEFVKKTGVNLHISARCINTAEDIWFSVENTPNISVIDALKASMSIPFMFEPIYIDGEYYLDCIVSNHNVLNDIDKRSLLFIYLPDEKNTNKNIYPKGTKFNLLEHMIRVTEIMLEKLLRKEPESQDYIFKITDLPYDSNMKFKITDDEIIVDVTKKDINDMIIKGFIDFSLYMKNRNRSLQT